MLYDAQRKRWTLILTDGYRLRMSGVERRRGHVEAEIALYRSVPGATEPGATEADEILAIDRLPLTREDARHEFAAKWGSDGRPDVGELRSALVRMCDTAVDILNQDAEPSDAAITSQTDALVALADAHGVQLFTSEGEDEPYAGLPVAGHVEYYPLRSQVVVSWLSRQLYEMYEKVPNPTALQSALATLEGRARFDNAPRPVFVRIGEHAGQLFLDLGDARWAAVGIDASGWRVVDRQPIVFRRARGTLPLPEPQRGGDLTALAGVLRLTATGEDDQRADNETAADAAWRLAVAWLVAAARPVGPYPILLLHGAPGSGKSTVTRALRAILDPNSAPIRSEPRSEHDLVIAAKNSHVIAIDNVTSLSPWLSDALCRLATGGGLSVRKLYTDADESLFSASRPIIVNGIASVATRADLLDRAMLIDLPTRTDSARRTEAELWHDFAHVHPYVLGALLTVVSGALGNLNPCVPKHLPRMADSVAWLARAEPSLDWEPGEFVRIYRDNRQEIAALLAENEPVVGAIIQLVEKCERAGAEGWEGNASALLQALTAEVRLDERLDLLRSGRWPNSPTKLGRKVRTLASALAAHGIKVDTDGRSARARVIRLSRIRRIRNDKDEGEQQPLALPDDDRPETAEEDAPEFVSPASLVSSTPATPNGDEESDDDPVMTPSSASVTPASPRTYIAEPGASDTSDTSVGNPSPVIPPNRCQQCGRGIIAAVATDGLCGACTLARAGGA